MRFGLTSGHEKAAFVKARARDREVAQRSSLGSSVARQEGRRLGTQHPHLLGELFFATEDCVTRYRLRVTDLVTKTVNYGRCDFVLFHGCVVWDRIPSSRLRSSLPSFATPSGNSSAGALFTQGLMTLVPPTICCVRVQSAREFVTEFSGGATPHRSGVAQS